MIYKRTLKFKQTDKPVIMVIDEYLKANKRASFSKCVLLGLNLFIEQKGKESPNVINKCINKTLKKLGADEFVKRIKSKVDIHAGRNSGDN